MTAGGRYKLNDAGEPVHCEDLYEWARWFETADRALASTEVGEARVSTVFLGLDHQHGKGRPLLWETMIFGGAYDDYQDRYSSRSEALVGHEQAVLMVKAGR